MDRPGDFAAADQIVNTFLEPVYDLFGAAKNQLSEDRFCRICSVNIGDIDQKAGEIWAARVILQPPKRS